MTFPFNPNIPSAPNDPADDQPIMQTNNASINSIIAVDHVGFNAASNGGFHNKSTYVSQGSNPATLANTNQVFSKTYTPNTTIGTPSTALFSVDSLGSVSQFTPGLAGNDGYQWIGSVLIQWGGVAFSTSTGTKTGTVVFKDRVNGAIPFPNNCFVITTTLSSSAGTPPISPGTALSVVGSSITNLQFSWRVLSTGNYNGFYWMAIGN